MFFAQNFLAGNYTAVGVRDALAGEIDENFKSHLVRLLKFRGGNDGELRLALLHNEHAQVCGADNPQINITFRIKADVSESQAHREIRGRRRRMIRADLSLQILNALNARGGYEVIREINFEAHNHGGIRAAHLSARHRGPRAGHHLQLSGEERHEGFRRALDINDIDVKAVLFEKSHVFGHPKDRGGPGVGGNVNEIQPLLSPDVGGHAPQYEGCQRNGDYSL